MNRVNSLIAYLKLSSGGINLTVIDVRIVAQVALKANATSLILCHNHPSGSVKPSSRDIEITKKIKEGLQLLDIELIDHIIYCENTYYSLKDEGNF